MITDVSDILYQARTNNNLTHKELSELSGYTRASISKYEHGTANPKFNAVQDILQSMGYEIIILKANTFEDVMLG